MCTFVALQSRKFPDLSLEPLHTQGLSDRDAAFAHHLYNLVVSRWFTCQHLIQEHLHKPWREMLPPAKAALLVGTAQILFMDRVPIRAAVHESVAWVKSNGGLNTGKMVNAILRRMAAHVEFEPERDPEADVVMPRPGERMREPELERRTRERWTDRTDELPLPDGRALVLTGALLPDDPMRRLEVATSHPIELLRSWAKHMSLAEVRKIALHGIAVPPVIVNTTHATRELPTDVLRTHSVPGHHLYTGAMSDLGRFLSEREDLWVQDPASTLAVGSIADLSPRVIYDVCAGLGTKTRQLAASFPEARIVATDIDEVRLAGLRKAFEGHPRVEVIKHEELAMRSGVCDLVVLDVPCTNTGVLARRPEARYRHQPKRVDELIGVQRQIIADSIRLLPGGGASGGGAILYSTCSLDPRENEEQARWARKWHDFEISREHRRLPEGGPGEPDERYTDGSYAVLLTR
ncbi:MAG: hypothetical protein Tsb0013_01410 [Phycisphaerales bacterium]